MYVESNMRRKLPTFIIDLALEFESGQWDTACFFWLEETKFCYILWSTCWSPLPKKTHTKTTSTHQKVIEKNIWETPQRLQTKHLQRKLNSKHTVKQCWLYFSLTFMHASGTSSMAVDLWERGFFVHSEKSRDLRSAHWPRSDPTWDVDWHAGRFCCSQWNFGRRCLAYVDMYDSYDW